MGETCGRGLPVAAAAGDAAAAAGLELETGVEDGDEEFPPEADL